MRDAPFLVDKRTRSDDTNLKLLLAFGLRRDSDCLGVGTNEGLFLSDFRRFAPSEHHIAYEPIRRGSIPRWIFVTVTAQNRSTNSSAKTLAFVCSTWMATGRSDCPSSLMDSELGGTGSLTNRHPRSDSSCPISRW
jgi:hypothetical protein